MSRRQRSSSIQRPMQSTLSLDPATVVRVKLLEPPRTSTGKRGLLLTYFFLLYLLCLLGLSMVCFIYAIPSVNHPTRSVGDGKLLVTLSHPSFLFLNEETEINVSLQNPGKEALSGNLVILFGKSGDVHPLAEGTTGIKIERLEGGESMTKLLRVSATSQTSNAKLVLISLAGSIDNQLFSVDKISEMKVAPFPYIKSLSNELWRLFLLAILAPFGLFWDEIVKKRTLGAGGQ